jgi:ParB family chromosome partitioning protein
VSNLLRLLELPDEITAFVERRELEMGHARALLGLPQRRQQIEIGAMVAKRGLSVRDTEGMVRALLAKANGGAGASKEAGKSLDPNVQRLQDELSEKLGAPVQIQHTGSGKGKVVVTYHSLDELDGILAHIN